MSILRRKERGLKTATELAEQLGCLPSELCRRMTLGRVPSPKTRFGKRRYYTAEEFSKIVKTLKGEQ